MNESENKKIYFEKRVDIYFDTNYYWLKTLGIINLKKPYTSSHSIYQIVVFHKNRRLIERESAEDF